MDEVMCDGLRWYMDKERTEAFDKLIGGIRSSLVLDVGAGDGSPLTHFLERYGAKVIALDRDKKIIKDNPSTPVIADALYLPFKPNQFDIVISEKLIIHSLFNMTNWTNVRRLESDPTSQPNFDATDLFLEEVYRVLKPSGIYMGNENIDVFSHLEKRGFQDLHQVLAKTYLFGRKP